MCLTCGVRARSVKTKKVVRTRHDQTAERGWPGRQGRGWGGVLNSGLTTNVPVGWGECLGASGACGARCVIGGTHGA